jgi:hypothetical protein
MPFDDPHPAGAEEACPINSQVGSAPRTLRLSGVRDYGRSRQSGSYSPNRVSATPSRSRPGSPILISGPAWRRLERFTPYGEAQMQSFTSPSYSETGASALSAPTAFALSDDARNGATARTKVGPGSTTEAGQALAIGCQTLTANAAEQA